MCTYHKIIHNSEKWNWNGDVIVYKPIIPNSRKVAGTNKPYDVDIREFITSKDNAVVKRTLEIISNQLHNSNKELFLSKKRGSFDFKAKVLKEFISHEIVYIKGTERHDPYRFPEETITLKSGDCEDRAFLLASLMIVAGISSYNVRVAFGKIISETDGSVFDHVWVMYKKEEGFWEIIEPLAFCNSKNIFKNGKIIKIDNEVETDFSYIPYFLANDEHVWLVRNQENKLIFSDYLSQRNFLEGYNPAFGWSVHKNLITNSIKPQDFYNKLTENTKNELFLFHNNRDLSPEDYLNSFAKKVANVDITLNYNPLLHFDNSFIIESFNLLNQNYKEKTIKGLAKSLHAIADFYAHSSYAEFARKIDGQIELLKTANPDDSAYKSQFSVLPNYASGNYNFYNPDFTINSKLYTYPDKSKAVQFWNGKIISGRFGQPKDSLGLLEHTQFWPANLHPSTMQAALPHHNEIAVDSDTLNKSKHKLYDEKEFKNQYKIRNKAASCHIKQLFEKWEN